MQVSGNIQRRIKDDKYYGNYIAYFRVNGRQKSKSTGTTSKPKAKEFLRKLLNQYEGGATNNKMMCADLFDSYKKYFYGTLKYNTQQNYDVIFKDLKEYFKLYRVVDVMPSTILDYVSDKKEILSYNTIAQRVSVLNISFIYAIDYLKIRNDNPCQNIKVSKIVKFKPRATTIWTMPQCEKYLNGIKGRNYYMPLKLCFTIGTRESEVVGMRLNDYNFKTKELIIREPMNRANRHEETTKNGDISRIVVLNDLVAKQLEKHILMMKKRKLQQPSFNPTNSMFNYKIKSLSEIFKRTRIELGLPYMRFHDIRTTCITLLLESGQEDIKKVADMVGHKSTATTEKIYQKVTPQMRADLAVKSGMLFANC